ncbi:MAG: hypothetical protein ABS939_24995 [Psychrobacillus sp.]
MAEKIINKDVKFVDLKPRTTKNFYVVGRDSKGKSFIGTIENVTLVQARREGKAWAKRHELVFEGVYSN